MIVDHPRQQRRDFGGLGRRHRQFRIAETIRDGLSQLDHGRPVNHHGTHVQQDTFYRPLDKRRIGGVDHPAQLDMDQRFGARRPVEVPVLVGHEGQ